MLAYMLPVACWLTCCRQPACWFTCCRQQVLPWWGVSSLSPPRLELMTVEATSNSASSNVSREEDLENNRDKLWLIQTLSVYDVYNFSCYCFPWALGHTTLYYTTLHYTTRPYYTTIRYATLHYTKLRYPAILHYTILHYTTLHYTKLH